jgi:peptidoglycan LD-endopeptidase CwlK
MTVVISLFLYFCVSCAVLTIVFLPAVRRRVFEQIRRLTKLAAGVQVQNQALLSRGQKLHGFLFSRLVVSPYFWLTKHWRRVSLGVMALVLIPMLAVGYRYWNRIETFDHTFSQAADKQIVSLLAGDRLVPPPPIPPERFATMISVEVEQMRPLVKFANRQWDLLDPDFTQRLLVVFQIMKDRHGYDMVLLEGYRSPARQEQLLSMGNSVTKAGANMSYHQFGLAGDCAFMLNGKIVISEKEPWAMKGYEYFGVIAKEVGLVWGGSWKSILDFGHVELRRPGVLGKGQANSESAGQRSAH